MENTTIGWTHLILPDGRTLPGHTFNAWYGCQEIRPECRRCYAKYRMDTRLGMVKWGEARKRTKDWSGPPKWNRKAAELGEHHCVFANSLGDWLDEDVPIEWFGDLLLLIDRTPNLEWLLLSKRCENWEKRFFELIDSGHEAAEIASYWLNREPPLNVHAGATIGHPKSYSQLYPLVNIPAQSNFLSCEPLLADLRLDDALLDRVDWALIGGESDRSDPAPFEINHALNLIDRFRTADVAVYVKQLGSKCTWNGEPYRTKHWKGEDIDEFPEALKIREFPDALLHWYYEKHHGVLT